MSLSVPSLESAASSTRAPLPHGIAESLDSLAKKMSRAATYGEWRALAEAHDAVSGAEEWRQTTSSSLYDYKEIQVRQARLQQILASGSTHELLYALNEGVHGNMGGMGRAVLYGRSMCGTKHLIESYVATIAEAIERLANAPDSEISQA